MGTASHQIDEMQRAYHTPVNLNGYHRPTPRIASVGSLHERAYPYNYHDFRYEQRPEVYSRQASYSAAPEPEQGAGSAQARRRIAVAVSSGSVQVHMY